MHLIKKPLTCYEFFFLNAHKKHYNKAIFNFLFFLNPVLTETPEMTEKGVVPMPGLTWCCVFTPVKVKEEDLEGQCVVTLRKVPSEFTGS